MNIKMEPDELIYQEYWKVLQKIKRLYYFKPDFGDEIDIGPVTDTEKGVLFRLQDMGAIKLLNLERFSMPRIIGEYTQQEAKLEVIRPVFNEIYEEVENEIKSSNSRAGDAQIQKSNRLIFNPEDGVALYRGAEYTFIGKVKALATLLYKNKNVPFTVDEIITKCNPNIGVEKSRFKGDKDIRDTVSYMREQLKVKKGEFFPIQKIDNNWLLVEK